MIDRFIADYTDRGYNFNVTRRALSLSASPDTTTGWYGKTYAETTITGLVRRKGSTLMLGGFGFYGKHDNTFYTATALAEGDEVKDADNRYYSVKLVQPELLGATLATYVCDAEYLPMHSDRPATYGTGAYVDDARYRTKLYIDTYLPKASTVFTATSNGAADGTTIINTAHTQADDYWNTAVVEMLTGTCAGEKAVVSDFTASSDTLTLTGAGFSAQIDAADTYCIHRIHKDDGTTPATWLSCWAGFDYPLSALLLSTGKNLDGIYAIGQGTSTPHLRYDHKPYAYTDEIPITIYVADKTGITGENINNQMAMELRRIIETLPTPSLRTLNNGKPEKVGIAPIYAYTYMLSYKRAVETTPTTPTVTFGASQGTTYTFPNITYLNIEPITNNVRLNSIGRVGSHLQKFGAPDYTITLRADLDMEPWTGVTADTKLSWKRPQTNGTKTDTINEQVFFDIYFNGLSAEVYQNLTLFGAAIPITLEKPQVTRTGDIYELNLTFKAYSASAATAYKTWFGIT